jgi:hypothetical protein
MVIYGTHAPSRLPYVLCAAATTEGAAAGGCADDSSTWPAYSECDACCDLSDCAETLAQGPAKGSSLSHSCGKCSEKECTNFGGYQR